MSAVWADAPDGRWKQREPAGFALESQLQEMVYRSVGMLPFAGAPVVVALAREVEVPTTRGRVDLLAVETDGSLVLIEVKLKQNQEARRAAVAQVLSYAASLKGSTVEVLLDRLIAAGFDGGSIAQAVGDIAPIDEDDFNVALARSLAEGRFRLVLVLDEAPAELVRLVGYLESMSGGLLSIDLIAVSVYQLGERSLAVPQRIDPQHQEATVASTGPERRPVLSERGSDLFAAAIAQAPEGNQPALEAMLQWAKQLEHTGQTSLISRQGAARTVLTLRVPGEDAGLVALWNDNGGPYLWLHGTVLDRRSPIAASKFKELLGKEVGFRSALKWSEVSPAIRELIEGAYVEASEPG